MRRSAYVFCVIGESPAVLSELLWWLAVKERRAIAGIEVWATGRGARHLRDLVASDAWQSLEEQTGPLPPLQPAERPPDASFGFRIHRFDLDGVVLDDVRSPEESAAVAARLHDRVRAARAALSDAIDLVGSLAGGRKTVSASLQTAFCLQAGRSDRLVHVLLHSDLERELRQSSQLADFCAPEPRWEALSGVPMAEQVLVYDVAFPRIRQLVPRRLAHVLEELSWQEVWPALERNMGMQAEARLFRTAELTWRFVITDPDTEDVLYNKALNARMGSIFAAMASTPEGVERSALDLVRWLDEHPAGWRPPSDSTDDDETRGRAIRNAVSTLRGLLGDLPIGLERYTPPAAGFVVREVEVSLSVARDAVFRD